MSMMVEAGRGAAFGLLSLLFLYPGDAQMEYLEAGGLEELEELFVSLEVEAGEVLEDLKARLNGNTEARAELLLDLQRDYTRLFVNAFPRVAAPPYSSVYLDGRGKVWGESTSKVVQLYRAAGLEMSDKFKDVPDHIAAELACASYLLLLIEQGKERGRELYRELVEDHLSWWAPEFLGRVIKNNTSPFYSKLSEVTLKKLEVESAWLSTSSLS